MWFVLFIARAPGAAPKSQQQVLFCFGFLFRWFSAQLFSSLSWSSVLRFAPVRGLRLLRGWSRSDVLCFVVVRCRAPSETSARCQQLVQCAPCCRPRGNALASVMCFSLVLLLFFYCRSDVAPQPQLRPGMAPLHCFPVSVCRR